MREKFTDHEHLGKFEGESAFSEYLYSLTMVSGEDEQIGDSVSGPGIAFKLGRHVIIEDTHGFIYHRKMPSRDTELHDWLDENYPDITIWADQPDEEAMA